MKANTWTWLAKVVIATALLTLGSLSRATTEYVYDSLGRLINVVNSDGSTIHYDYDANGNVTSINRVASPALSVSSFAPQSTYAGSTVTVYGTGFNTNSQQNNVAIGGAHAVVSSASLTALSVVVPATASTGPVAVTVAGVTATSAQSLTVLRPTISSVTPSAVNSGATVTVSGDNFNLVPGSTTIAVGSTNVVPNSLTNSQAVFTAPSTSGYVSVNTSYGQAVSAAPLVIAPSGLPAANVLAVAALSVGGSAQALNVNQQGKYGLYAFDAVQGQYLSIQISSLATTPSGGQLNYTMYSPSNSVVASGTLAAANRSIHLPVIPTTGSYLVSFTSSTASFQMTAILESNVAVSVDGASAPLPTTLAAQSKRFIFSASAGENIGVGISNLVETNFNTGWGYSYLNVYKPDGSALVASLQCVIANTGCDVNLSNLPQSGLYSVVLQSSNPGGEPNVTMSYTATVSHDLVVPLTAGTPASANLNRRGQNGRLTFSGTAGAAMGIQIAAGPTVPSALVTSVAVLKPDGTNLIAATTNTYGGTALQIPNLPVSGTYTVFVDPQFGATVNVTATLVSASGGAVAVDGASQSVSSSAYSYFGFSGTAGENIGVGISNLVETNFNTSWGYSNLYVLKPDGSVLAGPIQCLVANGACDANLSNLPQTGLYGVILQSPNSNGERSVTISYTATVSHDLVVPLTAGTPASANLNRRGQNGRLTFSGTAGAAMGIQIAAGPTVPSTLMTNVTVLKPDGATLIAATNAYGGAAIQLANLPVTGTYTVFVDPQFGATVNVTAMLVSAGGGAVAVDGASRSISSSAYSYFGFSGTAGENIGVGISNLVETNFNTSWGYSNLYVMKPDGSVLVGPIQCIIANGACDANLSNLPQTGLYGVIVQSPNANGERSLTLSYTATVSHDLVVPLTAGAPASANLNRRGQNGRLTFSGTAGTTMGIQIAAGPTVPSMLMTSVAVLKPDGTSLITPTTNTYGGTALQLANLPVTGTYTVFVDPQFGATVNVTATLVSASGGAVAVDGASQSVSSSAYSYFGFSGTAGENIGIGISNLVETNFNTSWGYSNLYVVKPDGSILVGPIQCLIANGACDVNLSNLPQTGLYGVSLQSPNSSGERNVTMSYTATVSHDLVVPLTTGTPSSVNLNRNGLNGRFTFSGTSGGSATVQISGVSTTPAGRSVSLIVLKPDGTTQASSSTTSTYTFNLTSLPVAGTYTLFVDPQYGSMANVTVTRQ